MTQMLNASFMTYLVYLFPSMFRCFVLRYMYMIKEKDTYLKVVRFFILEPLLKLLVPNYAAGGLIGKGGTLITEMQNKFGGNIRLSSNREYYPGTDERVVVVTGEVNQIIDFNNHIMEKVLGDPSKQSERSPRDEGRGQKVKIVLTNGAAGLLIGRAGITIKAIQEESKAKISICSLEVASVPGERVLTMSGSTEQLVEGCRQVIEKISGDASNMANTKLKYMSANMGVNHGGNVGFNSMQQDNNDIFSVLSGNPMAGLRGASNMQGGNNFGGQSYQGSKSKLKTKVEVQMEVPDVLVGAILGKQGQVIREFAQRSGARFKFSDKNEYAAGTTDRILTITGDMNQAQTAHSLINERVEQAGSQLYNR